MAEKRADIILRCSVCKNENYITTKNKRAHPDKFTCMKFCPKCKKMTLHEEKK
jgi:large subunit ribosomal protein L33